MCEAKKNIKADVILLLYIHTYILKNADPLRVNKNIQILNFNSLLCELVHLKYLYVFHKHMLVLRGYASINF